MGEGNFVCTCSAMRLSVKYSLPVVYAETDHSAQQSIVFKGLTIAQTMNKQTAG